MKNPKRWNLKMHRSHYNFYAKKAVQKALNFANFGRRVEPHIFCTRNFLWVPSFCERKGGDLIARPKTTTKYGYASPLECLPVGMCYGKFWIIDNPELFCTIFIGLEKLIGRAENLESVPTKLDRAWEWSIFCWVRTIFMCLHRFYVLAQKIYAWTNFVRACSCFCAIYI
jgi:hypothetical protein